MIVNDIIKKYYDELGDFYPKTEIQSFLNCIFEFKLHFSSVDFHQKKQLELTPENEVFFEDVLNRLKKHEPLQYILGKTEFYGMKFIVNKYVLIPRPETEELVDIILKNEHFSFQDNVLDIGTGSGCIAVSLAKNTMANIFALDVSEKALIVAEQNAELNRVEIDFIQKNILETEEISDINLKFNLIISNPPYVRESEKMQMKPNVLDYEPNLALFVKDDNALLFYDAIATFAEKHLIENGRIYLEINEFLAQNTVKFFEKHNFQLVQSIKDLSGKDRFIRVVK